VIVNGQQAIDALKTNNTFKTVGISLRNDRPGMQLLAKASERLTELSGDMVVPIEDEISKATMKLLPQLQHSYGSLPEKLKSMNLPGMERLEILSQDIADILFNDASDAPRRIGSDESTLYANLKWASNLKQSLDEGLEDILRQLLSHLSEIDLLPESGTPGLLKIELVDEINQLKARLASMDFFNYSSEFASSLTYLKVRVRDTSKKMEIEQQNRIKEGEKDLIRIVEWKELTIQEQNNLLTDLENLRISNTEDISGLRALVNQEYNIQNQLNDLKQSVQRIGQQRIQERLKEKQEEAKTSGDKKIVYCVNPQRCITSIDTLDELINELQQIRGELQFAHAFELTINSTDNNNTGE